MTRRQMLAKGLKASLALTAAGAGALFWARHRGMPAPGYGKLFGLSDLLTFATQRLLLRGQPLAREFDRAQISPKFPTTGTTNPKDEAYHRSRLDRFEHWRLPIEGLVARPGQVSLAELKALPARTQVTQHVCQEGWSAIAEWTGVPLWRVLETVTLLPEARYVVFYCVDGWWDSLDLFDALHPQTLLAYGMNGEDLPMAHGAPVRLRVERQLGYKSLKYISRICVVDRLDNIGNGKGSSGAAFGYAWYAGI